MGRPHRSEGNFVNDRQSLSQLNFPLRSWNETAQLLRKVYELALKKTVQNVRSCVISGQNRHVDPVIRNLERSICGPPREKHAVDLLKIAARL